MEENSVSIDRVWRTHERVLAFSGSSWEGAIQGRIVPSRGWIFLLVGEPGAAIETLRGLLDSTIAEFEGAGDALGLSTLSGYAFESAAAALLGAALAYSLASLVSFG